MLGPRSLVKIQLAQVVNFELAPTRFSDGRPNLFRSGHESAAFAIKSAIKVAKNTANKKGLPTGSL